MGDSQLCALSVGCRWALGIPIPPHSRQGISFTVTPASVPVWPCLPPFSALQCSKPTCLWAKFLLTGNLWFH